MTHVLGRAAVERGLIRAAGVIHPTTRAPSPGNQLVSSGNIFGAEKPGRSRVNGGTPVQQDGLHQPLS